MQNLRKKVSIIIPAHNEEKRIGNTLNAYVNYFKNKCEILVILNNCCDGTLKIVKDCADKHSIVTYINMPAPVGKGGAIIEGFKMFDGDVVAYVDADGATKPDALARLIDNIGQCDGIVASRWTRGALILNRQPVLRRLASRVFNILVRTLFLLPHKDTQCGAKVFKKEVIKDVVNELGTTNFVFDVDLLYLVHKKSYKIKELPTVWSDQNGSTLNLKKVAPTMFASIIRLRLKHSILKGLMKGL